MDFRKNLPEQESISLAFKNKSLEEDFLASYDRSTRIPLLNGIIISLLSWYGSIPLIYYIVPEKFYWFAPLTLVYIGSYFGFLIYVSYFKKMEGRYHILGAISNAWAGLYTIFYCHQFPNGVYSILPVIIFIIFFGSYMIRLRWKEGAIAASTYVLGYVYYISVYSDLSMGQIAFYSFVSAITFIFAFIAGRMVENYNRLNFVQRRIIAEQSSIIEKEKDWLLKEVHHRVKNNLQIINSLLRFQIDDSSHAHAKGSLKQIQSRVLSMSLVHKRVNTEMDYTQLVLKDYIHELIESSSDVFEYPSVTKKINVSDDILLDVDKAIPFGLILNELLANLFMDETDSEKSFEINASISDSNGCKIEYKDNGVPLLNTSDESRLLCEELIQVFSEQLDGTYKLLDENGNVCKLEFDHL